MFRKYFIAIGKDLISLITGIASIPFTVMAFWVNTPTIRYAWFISAFVCFIVASYKVWANEYCRAEKAETQKATPYVTIDKYIGFYAEDETTAEEYLVENLRIVNRGSTAALSVEIPSIQILGKTARLLTQPPTLGPNESIECRILNLKHVLDGINNKIPKERGKPWSVRIPLTVHYRDANHNSLKTDHAISYNINGISFEIVHPNDPQDWTNLSEIEQLKSN
ncbi:MAG: hypothetical protein ABIL62_13100 [Planctomycetota bacterium]